ncbi:MAG: OmpA family protein [Nitrospinota bacterium]
MAQNVRRMSERRGRFLFALGLTLSVGLLGACASTEEIQRATARAERLEGELRRARQEREGLARRAESIQATLRQARARGDALTRRLAQERRRAEGHEARVVELEAAQVRLEEKQRAAEKRLQSLESDRRALREQVRLLGARLGKARAEVVRREEKLELRGRVYRELAASLRQEIAAGEVKLKEVEGRLTLSLLSRLLFDSGSAEVSENGRRVLDRLGKTLKTVRDREIQVQGHTDNVPIGPNLRERFATNWELSALRATNVVRYLESVVGVDPRLLSAAGYSMYRSVASNETPEGRQANRRIEIILIPRLRKAGSGRRAPARAPAPTPPKPSQVGAPG